LISHNEWSVPNHVVDEEICKKIIKLGDDGFEPAKVGRAWKYSDPDEFVVNRGLRISDMKKLISYRWIIDLITPIVEAANIEAGWKYDIRGVEALQLGRYGVGGFYHWHNDGLGDHESAINYGDDPTEYVRKLSLTLVLNNDYEGGQFQLASYASPSRTIISTPELNKTGSLIVFPSFMDHRVTPVTKGTRYSLVGWFLGPPFR
jgi:PKHD-type hydroxylase